MKIIQFCSYPTGLPTHGGQKRVSEIARDLRGRNHDVTTVGVSQVKSHGLDASSSSDIIISDPAYLDLWAQHPECEDIFLFYLDLLAPAAFKDLERQLFAEDYDILMLEQPWLWPSIRKIYQARSHGLPAIVYSSQNVEYTMRSPAEEAEPGSESESMGAVAELILDVEKDLCAQAGGVIVTTKQDGDSLSSWSAKTLLCPNAATGFRCDSERVSKWRDVKKKAAAFWALFVGSAHKPNSEGFLAEYGDNLSWLPPGAEIVVIGGVQHALAEALFTGEYSLVNESRCHFLSNVDDSDLSALYQLADAVLLPIHGGGGSNLKTAEALMSEQPIIGTSFAFRGYEDFADSAGVHIADGGDTAISIVQRMVGEPEKGQLQRAGLERLTWKHSLEPLEGFLQELESAEAPECWPPLKLRHPFGR